LENFSSNNILHIPIKLYFREKRSEACERQTVEMSGLKRRSQHFNSCTHAHIHSFPTVSEHCCIKDNNFAC